MDNQILSQKLSLLLDLNNQVDEIVKLRVALNEGHKVGFFVPNKDIEIVVEGKYMKYIVDDMQKGISEKIIKIREELKRDL